MRRFSLLGVAILFTAVGLAQSITVPPSGDNQKSVVTQSIGPVSVSIAYSSPDVHSPSGADRRGKIWGDLVPWGMANLGFGTCGDNCPWRAGANENTVFTVSHDVMVQDQRLPAGSYGLHLIPQKDSDWTLIFSKNSTSWGSFFYDPAEDALRVKVTPAKSDYHEWLTYEFTDRQPDKATVALKWEDLQIPWTVSVPNISDVYIAEISKELRSFPGFNWQNWNTAARYALDAKRYDVALQWAQKAVDESQGIGLANFRTLSILADAQEASGMMAEATKTRDRALNHATANAIDLHQYARRLVSQGKKQEALRVWQLSAKRFGDVWPVNVGLARGYSAVGDYKQALRYARLAVKQAPDEANRKNLEAAVKKLEEGKDMNQ